MKTEQLFSKMVESINLLAKPYDEQKKALPGFVDLPEDVISEFENSFLLLPQLIEANYFSTNGIASFIRLYNEVQWCVRNVGLEDLQLFKSHDKWNNVRRNAKELLVVLQQ